MAEKKEGKTAKTKTPGQQAAQPQGQSQGQPQAQQGAPRQATPRPQRPSASHVLGEVAWLMSQSKGHKHFRMEDLSWFVMPPVMLEQYRIFLGRQQDPNNSQVQTEVPMGVALWAMFSKDVERKFIETVKEGKGPVQLKPKDWNSGNRLWLIELIAPFATEENKQIAMMMDDFLKNGLTRAFQVAKDNKVKFFQTDKETGERKVVELQAQFSTADGQKVDPQQAANTDADGGSGAQS